MLALQSGYVEPRPLPVCSQVSEDVGKNVLLLIDAIFEDKNRHKSGDFLVAIWGESLLSGLETR